MALCLCVVACSGNKQTQNDDKYTKIGTSEFSIILPEGYAATEDDLDEDQIAYYFKDDQSIDFDVYQWDKEGKYTLKEEAAYFASEYNATAEEIETDLTFVGLLGLNDPPREGIIEEIETLK